MLAHQIVDDATEEEIELGIRYRLPHRSSKAPHIALMQTFQAQGLALVNLRPPGIEFDHSEDHIELTSRLTGMFPKLFQHLFGLETPNMDSPWLLCSRGKKNSLMLVPHTERPSGEDIYKQALTQGRSGFTSKTIYFSMYEYVFLGVRHLTMSPSYTSTYSPRNTSFLDSWLCDPYSFFQSRFRQFQFLKLCGESKAYSKA